VVIDAVNRRYATRRLNVALHLYTGAELDSFAYDQIDRLRARIPSGRRIAISEAGVLDPGLPSGELGRLDVEFLRRVTAHLRRGDYLLDQVLYNPRGRGNTASLNPESSGMTPKGKLVLAFLKGLWY